MAQVSFTATGATTYNLTSTSTNPDAYAEATPREGGFTMQNRVIWANVTAPTLTNKVMNVLRLLKIPRKTVVTGLYLASPAGSGGCTHNCNSQSISSGTVGVGFSAYKSASQSSASTDADGFAQATLSKSKMHTSSVLALPTDPETSPKGSVRHVAVGIAGANQGWADSTGDAQTAMHFPHGGFITMQIEAGKGPSGVAASSLDGAFSGTLDIIAKGYKLRE